MSIHEFQQLGGPAGHRRCKLHILDSNERNFECECGKEFETRDGLVAHAKLEAELLASVVTK